jgi:hypothetical protein
MMMKHQQFEEWIILAQYEELSEQETEILKQHIEVCPSCQQEVNALKRLHTTMMHRRLHVNHEQVLQDARRAVRLKMQEQYLEPSLWTKVRQFWNHIFAQPVFAAFGGAAVTMVIIAMGYVAFSYSNFSSPGFQRASFREQGLVTGESQVANLRFIDRDERTGNIEFTFESITPVRIQGNVNDEHVQKVLARALVNEQNAGIRLRAVNMIGTQADQKLSGAPKLNYEVRNALIAALLHDRNLGVRREALQVLKNYLPDTTIVRAFLVVLASEKNTGLKIAAINSLDLAQYEHHPMNKEIQDLLRSKVQSDDNNYIRIKARTALQEVQ